MSFRWMWSIWRYKWYKCTWILTFIHSLGNTFLLRNGTYEDFMCLLNDWHKDWQKELTLYFMSINFTCLFIALFYFDDGWKATTLSVFIFVVYLSSCVFNFVCISFCDFFHKICKIKYSLIFSGFRNREIKYTWALGRKSQISSTFWIVLIHFQDIKHFSKSSMILVSNLMFDVSSLKLIS